jgi:hypothetical protein
MFIIHFCIHVTVVAGYPDLQFTMAVKELENEELQVFNEDFNIGFVSKEAEFHKMKKSLDYQIRQTLAIPSIMAAYS